MTGRKHVGRAGGKRGASRWPCTVCKKQCVTDAIFCEHCCEWAHYACENLGKEEFKELSNLSCAYVCKKCRVDQEEKFDFKKSLERLCKASASVTALHQAAIVEKILIKNHPFHSPAKEPILRGDSKIHQYSQSVINTCGRTASRVPVHVRGDGNCLFNAVSVAIQGDEARSCELRVRTCLELVLNFEHYKNHPRYKSFRLVSPSLVKACINCARDGTFSSIFTVQALSSVIDGEIVSVYPAMNGMLDNCLPILNTVISPRLSLSKNRRRDRVYVFWTRMCGPFPQPQDKIWLPNHFVPLIESASKTSSSPVRVGTTPSPAKSTTKTSARPVHADTSPSPTKSKTKTSARPVHADTTPSPTKSTTKTSARPVRVNTTPSPAKSTMKTSARPVRVNTISSPPTKSTMKTSARPVRVNTISSPPTKSTMKTSVRHVRTNTTPSPPAKPTLKTSSPVRVDTTPSPHFTVSPLEASTMNECSPTCSPSRLFSSNLETAKQPNCTGINQQPDCLSPEVTKLSNPENLQSDQSHSPDRAAQDYSTAKSNKLPGRFLDIESLCELLKNDQCDTNVKIPSGVKENVFFIVNNERNVEKRKRGQKSNYEDDCGSWDSKSSSTKKTVFHCVSGVLRVVEIKNGKYSTKRQKEWVPLEPQPNENDIMVMRRFYASLKRQPDYKKRVTWIEKASSGMVTCIGKAVVEYLGTFPSTTSVHGNSKKGICSEYVRTCEATKQIINDRIKNEPPRNVYCDMVLDNSMDAPRDLKQVQNFKQAKARADKLPGTNRKNTADDVQTIINMMNDHPFIQEVVQMKGKPPMVILYTEYQLKDVKKFCLTPGNTSILGVDRTFNLGACFVTLTVFKHSYLLRRSAQASPIMLGPLFLHWDGTCMTYQRFFSHLRTKLDADLNTEVGFSDLVIGSDEELAILKAVQQSFPNATQLLCQRHLEQNVRRNLQHKVGVPDKLRNEIVSLIFGKDSLINSKDLVDFELTCLELSNKFLAIAPNFVTYFDTSLVPRIRDYMFKPKVLGSCVPLNWTNNNCESLNNIVKLSTNWKALKLPDLIEKMYGIVKLQYADMRRALHGHGNYELIPKLKYLVLPNTVWCQKNESEKIRHFQKFMSATTRKDQAKTVVSTDGDLVIPVTPAIARKPGQRKRIRTDRTRTIYKKQKRH